MSDNNGSSEIAMPPDLQASLLCDDVRQERNGKFMLIGIFEGLILPGFPFQFPRLCVVNRWCSGMGEFSHRTRIVAADGSRLVEGQPMRLALSSVDKVATSVEYFINFPIAQPGMYWVEILLEAQLRLRYPLHIRKSNEPT